MVKLSQVKIVNFRSIKNFTLSFEPSCRILVGINESGKSNILRALSLLDPTQQTSRRTDRREPLPDEERITDAYVEFNFRFDRSEAHAVHQQALEDLFIEGESFSTSPDKSSKFSLSEVCERFLGARMRIDIDSSERESHGEVFAQIASANQWFKVGENCPKDAIVNLNGKNRHLHKYKFIQTDSLSGYEYLHPVEFSFVIDHIRELANSFSRSHPLTALAWQYDEKNLLPSQISISEFRNNPDICTPLKSMFTLWGVKDFRSELDPENYSGRNGFQNFLNRVAERTTAHFRTVWKEYQDIRFALIRDADLIVPSIKERNHFDLAMRSDGFKRFVTFLLMVSAHVRTGNLNNTLLLIDEPDFGLHPSGARYLRDELIRISAKNYVVYSTHSIFMIDSKTIDRHYIVKKKDEITTATKSDNSNLRDEEVLFNALGYSIYECLREKNIIFEGWKDKILFQKGLERASQDTNQRLSAVGLCHARGVKSISQITPIIELARRTCLVLSDSDRAAKEHQKTFKEDRCYGDWKTYQEVAPSLNATTGEDFLKNSYIVRKLNDLCQRTNLPEFSGNLPDQEKLVAISEWLKDNGFDKNDIKLITTQVKTELFDDLDSTDIIDEYQMYISAVAEIVLPSSTG